MNLKNKLKEDYKRIYPKGMSFIKKIKLMITHDITYKRWKYIKYMRKCDEFSYKKSLFEKVRKLIYQRKKNKLGLILGYEINCSNIDGGLLLYHNGPIVINGNSLIGKNCSLHGDNCIGNDGISDLCPVIGDNVEIGVGAKIIGNCRVADNVIIGAGSIVCKDILEEGSIVVGVPAKVIKINGRKL